MQAFGSSMLAFRLLPVLISLCSRPLMYLLGWELFVAREVAWFVVALLALSPIDILFAQTARQYSLLTLTVIGSSYLLLKAAWAWLLCCPRALQPSLFRAELVGPQPVSPLATGTELA